MRGMERFLHSPILHCTHSSWIEKTLLKTIDYLRDYGFVYRSIGLYENLSQLNTSYKSIL